MKKYLFLAAACLSFAFTACSDDNTQDEGENTAPTCKITEPLEGETYDANLPLTIKGRINDKENNVSAVKLTVGGETVDEELSLPFFECTIAPEKLQKGALTVALYVEDTGGLNAQHQVTVNLEKDVKLMVSDDGKDELTFDYRSGEREVRVVSEKKWTVSVPEGTWFESYDAASQQWVKKTSISGEGNTAIKLRAGANDLFEDRYAELKISTPDETGKFVVGQTASPNMLDLIEWPPKSRRSCTEWMPTKTARYPPTKPNSCRRTAYPTDSTPEGGRWLPPKVSRTSRTCGIWMSTPPTT